MARAIPEDRFHTLIEAATAVFVEQGYRRTQIADVAARMGVAKGSVYTYVESKEALFDCALRHADSPDPIQLPDTLPVPTPLPGSTLETVRKRVAGGAAMPALSAALSRKRVTDVRVELETILGELYDTLARHRTAIKLLDRCAHDYPELAKVWLREGRERALSLLARYLEDRARRGRLRRFEDGAIAARIVLETVVFWAVHRHWDPHPQTVDESLAKDTVLRIIVGALVKE
jgi:AcrR family transcriptional regulator